MAPAHQTLQPRAYEPRAHYRPETCRPILVGTNIETLTFLLDLRFSKAVINGSQQIRYGSRWTRS